MVIYKKRPIESYVDAARDTGIFFIIILLYKYKAICYLYWTMDIKGEMKSKNRSVEYTCEYQWKVW